MGERRCAARLAGGGWHCIVCADSINMLICRCISFAYIANEGPLTVTPSPPRLRPRHAATDPSITSPSSRSALLHRAASSPHPAPCARVALIQRWSVTTPARPLPLAAPLSTPLPNTPPRPTLPPLHTLL